MQNPLLVHNFFYKKLATTSYKLLMLLFNNLCFMTSCRLLSPKTNSSFLTVNELKILKTARLTLDYFRKKAKQESLRTHTF